MDGDRFDHFIRTLGSRRTVLDGLLGGTLAVLLGLPGSEEARAHTLGAGCRRIQNVRRRRACLRRARAHNRTCHPNPAAVTCAGRCGVWPNNCGHPTRCPACPAGRTCTANGSCAEPCTDGSCASGCGCSIENWEGTRACVPFIFECPTQPCEGTAECPPGSQCQVCTTGGPSVCFPLCPS